MKALDTLKQERGLDPKVLHPLKARIWKRVSGPNPVLLSINTADRLARVTSLPQAVMMDKSDAFIHACKVVFPDAEIRLCRFHVAQAVSRWLKTSANEVKDRKQSHTALPLGDLAFSHCSHANSPVAHAPTAATDQSMLLGLWDAICRACTEQAINESELQ